MRNQLSIQVDFLLLLRRHRRGKPCLWSALGKWEGGAFVKFYALNDELRHDEEYLNRSWEICGTTRADAQDFLLQTEPQAPFAQPR